MIEVLVHLPLVAVGEPGDPAAFRRSTCTSLDNAWEQAVDRSRMRRMRTWLSGASPAFDLWIDGGDGTDGDAATLVFAFRGETEAQATVMRHLTLVVLSEESWVGFQGELRDHGWALAADDALLDAAADTPAIVQDRVKMGVVEGGSVAWVLPTSMDQPLAEVPPAKLARARSATGCGCGVCSMLSGKRARPCAPLLDEDVLMRVGGLAGNRYLAMRAGVSDRPTTLEAFGRAVVETKPGPVILAAVERIALRVFEDVGGELEQPVAAAPGSPERLPQVLAGIFEVWDDDDAFTDIGEAIGDWVVDATLAQVLPLGGDFRKAANRSVLKNAVERNEVDRFRALAAFGVPLRSPYDDIDLVHAAVIGNAHKQGGGANPILAELIAMGADVDGRDRERRTPLMAAVLRGDVAAAEELLEGCGADTTLVDREGWTALDHAAASWAPDAPERTALLRLVAAHSPQHRRNRALARIQHTQAGTLLLEAGAKLDGGDGIGGQTPLIWAVTSDDSALATMLLELGADPAATNDFGWTAHQVAVQQRRPQTRALLEEAGAPDLPPHFDLMRKAAYSGLNVNISRLLDQGVSIDTRDFVGRTPLITAARRGKLPCVAYLLDKGADANAADGSGRTALFHVAQSAKGEPLVRRLIAAGVDVNAADRLGETAMCMATLKGHARTLEVLAELGGSVDAVGEGGQPPLRIAALKGQRSPTRVLLELGADPNAAWRGQTPLMAAAVQDDKSTDDSRAKVVQMLLDAGADPTGGDPEYPAVDQAEHFGSRAVAAVLKTSRR